MKQPKYCKGCKHFHKAGHPKGSALRHSKYDVWCTKFGDAAYKNVGTCRMKGYKET
jgi:hypothetical protein